MGIRWQAVWALTALKLILIPSYRSTDFEVHRNWLAITSSLPISKWYTEATSEWTLDYPPLFAWFEWSLAKVARFMDPGMLSIPNLDYSTPETVLFQRLSVILTDGVLYSAAWFCTRRMKEPQRSVTFLLIVCNAGLLIVDHIHFQYNGMLLGILLWSIGLVQEGQDLLGGLVFAVLLNMKHLFACLSPLYFVYLLRHYCRAERAVQRFLLLGGVVALVFAVSFGPFVLAGQLEQVLGRLFPFKRGLMHAYWAANIWALYAVTDRALVTVLNRLGFPVNKPTALMTGGLVQVSSFAVLPDIDAGSTFAAVLISMGPVLLTNWRNPKPESFAKSAAYACLCSFICGYHVHEKAILMVILPLALAAARSVEDARTYLGLSITGHYALLPLLFTGNEYPIKMAIFLIYSLCSCMLLRACTAGEGENQQAGEDPTGSEKGVEPSRQGENRKVSGEAMGWVQFLGVWNVVYFCGMACLEVYCRLVHPKILPRLEFLPLLLTSVYCAIGLTKDWDCLARQILRGERS